MESSEFDSYTQIMKLRNDNPFYYTSTGIGKVITLDRDLKNEASSTETVPSGEPMSTLARRRAEKHGTREVKQPRFVLIPTYMVQYLGNIFTKSKSNYSKSWL